jgi:hypothetical protein
MNGFELSNRYAKSVLAYLRTRSFNRKSHHKTENDLSLMLWNELEFQSCRISKNRRNETKCGFNEHRNFNINEVGGER